MQIGEIIKEFMLVIIGALYAFDFLYTEGA